jgi:hypothetical protein
MGSVGVVFDATNEAGANGPASVAIHVPFARLQEGELFRSAFGEVTRASRGINHPRLVRTLDGGEGGLVWRGDRAC